MLAKDFEKWLIILIFDDIFFSVQMYITRLSYLDKKLSLFTKLLDSGNKESNRQLMSLDVVTFHNKDKKNSLKVGFKNLKLK